MTPSPIPDTPKLTKALKMAGIAILGAFLLLALSCSKVEKSKMATGAALDTSSMIGQTGGGYFGDSAYAVVSYASIPEVYAAFRKEIFDKGVVKWDERFDCNHFAGYFVSLAQVRYYLDNWGSGTKAQTLAMGVVWYRPAGGKGGHAVVEAVTDKGVVDIEPQTGQIFTMTETERQSVYLRVY